LFECDTRLSRRRRIKKFQSHDEAAAFSKKVKKIGDFPPLFLNRKIGIAVAQ
jgi:hypothetical protein